MTRLDDCTPAPEEQARYANSDDEERLVPKMVPGAEDRALAAMKKERDFFAKTKEKTGGIPSVRGWPADEIDRAFRDGVLAERERVRAVVSPEADDLELARYTMGLLSAIYAQFGPSHDGAVERDMINAIARALGEQRARIASAATTPATDVMEIVRDALAPLRLSPGSVPAYESADRKLCAALTAYAREAHAAAIEEAASLNYQALQKHSFSWPDAIRALAAAPPQSERPRRPLPFPHRFDGGSFGGGDQGECAKCGLDARDHDVPPQSKEGK